MRQQDDERRLILAQIPSQDALSPDEQAHAGRFILACQGAIVAADDAQRNAVAALMADMPDDASEWLDRVEAALRATPIADQERKATLFGAFKTARVICAGYDTTLDD